MLFIQKELTIRALKKAACFISTCPPGGRISRQAEFLLPGSPGGETLAVFAWSPNEGSTSTPTRAKNAERRPGLPSFLPEHQVSAPSLPEGAGCEPKNPAHRQNAPARVPVPGTERLSHPSCHLDTFLCFSYAQLEEQKGARKQTAVVSCLFIITCILRAAVCARRLEGAAALPGRGAGGFTQSLPLPWPGLCRGYRGAGTLHGGLGSGPTPRRACGVL